MKKIIVVILLSQVLSAQTSFDGTSLGMAGNYTAISRGVNAIAWNPANLVLYRGNNFEFNFVAINASLNNSSISISDYNKYFSQEGHKGTWSKADRTDIIDMFSGDGLGLNVDMNTNIFGFVAGQFGFGMQLINNASLNIKAGKPLEVVLFGETIDPDFSFKEKDVVNASAYSAVKNTFAYSYLFKLDKAFHTISHVAVGASLNFYWGLGVARSLESSASLHRIDTGGLEDNEEMLRYETNIAAQTADPSKGIAGKGFGLDIGTTVRFAKAWHFSLTFNNLFASINWDGNTQYVSYSRIDSSYIFSGSNKDTSYTTETKTKGKAFSTQLPMIMRAGLSVRLFKNLQLSADLHQGLNSAFGNSMVPRFGVGAEYKPLPWLPLRSGMAVGGRDVFIMGLGAGFHLGAIEIDFSYAMSKALLPVYSNGIFTSFSFKLTI